MIVYTVHEPPDAPVDRIDRADGLQFVSDGFNKLAVVLGPLWLLGNQLWLAAAGYAAVAAVIAGVVFGFGLAPQWLSLMFGALNLLLGFEASSLQRWSLERRGWRTLGTVSGRSIDECERRFLEGWLPEQGLARPRDGSGDGPGIGSRLAAMADGSAEGRLGRAPGGGLFGWARGRQ